MRIYEVFVSVPYYDPDYNLCYDRLNGTFFADVNKAKEFIDKMYNDENANYDLIVDNYVLKGMEDVERRYVTQSDYTETEMSWDYFCRIRHTMSDDEYRKHDAIFATNCLVDSLKYNNAIMLAVTYGGNKWFLREIEVH